MSQRVGASCFLLTIALALLLSVQARAQPAQGGPPAVGVVRAERQQMTQSDEFIGRIQAVNRVALVARVTGFLEKRLFVEGTEVKKDELLYQIEQPPFQAQVDAAKANVRAARGAAPQRRIHAAARPGAAANAGRPAIERRRRARLRARPGGADRRRPGAAGDRPDQSRLYRDPRADRRQDRPHRKSPKATSSRRPAARWRPSSARIRCMWSSRSRCAPGSICATAMPTRAATARS